MSNTIFHYPPELLNLLVDTIPLLNRSKKGVILFFKGAGVKDDLMIDLAKKVKFSPLEINKYEIAQTILTRLNEQGEKLLRERREVLKRVVEFESFEACWDSDRLKAKALVYEIRQVVNVKDTFTRMKNEKEKVEQKSREEYLKKVEAANKLAQAKTEFYEEISKMYFMKDRQKRGKLFEDVLNRLFKAFGILVKDAFTLSGDDNEGIIEQIDGVIELDAQLYLVEMKWWGEAVGRDEIANHLSRIFIRGEARGFSFPSMATLPLQSNCLRTL
ncbi:restriction endonuclease [Paenibacillus cellulositrophicus]|uniref:restriction endonuclease n=1 Tax=Paenibacillus cellulositrophicus TaxID=562959 RepID=UPI001AD7A933|nr:restriction endonuclease [Paenibacillus cellulositrophicus]